MAGDTAGNIVNAAAVQLGLMGFLSKPADPFASKDQNIGQLCQLFVSAGRDVRRSRQWNLLRKTYVFQTVSNQGVYPLPRNFGSIIDQSEWNRTSRLPLMGPLSPQQVQRFKAMMVGVTFNLMFEAVGSQFIALPDSTTPGGLIVAYEYVSSDWAKPATTHSISGPWINGYVYSPGAYVSHGGVIYVTVAGGTAGSYGPVGIGNTSDGVVDWTYVSDAGADTVTASSDIVSLDAELMTMALKYRWKREKGMDSSTAEEDYLEALARAGDDDAVAPKLNLSGGLSDIPLIGEQSIPLTGFGE